MPILDTVRRIVSYTIDDDYRMDNLLDGAMKLCYANRQPVATMPDPEVARRKKCVGSTLFN